MKQHGAVSVHYYTPSTLCILDKDASWGKAHTTWGNEDDIAEMNASIKMLKETFIDNHIPVIVGEYGCFGKNKEREVREYWTLTVSKAMYDAGICTVKGKCACKPIVSALVNRMSHIAHKQTYLFGRIGHSNY